MQQPFTIDKGFKAADGTVVYPFLNSKDSMSDLPWDLLSGFSLAAGDIEPGVHSKVHVHPVVTQVILVVAGRLDLMIKEPDRPQPHDFEVLPQQAAIVRPGTFMQLRNRSAEPCRVLYIVSPPYLFAFDETAGKVLYEDAVVLDENWSELETLNWKPAALPTDVSNSRAFAYGWLEQRRIARVDAESGDLRRNRPL